jgi:hypothetical protein
MGRYKVATLLDGTKTCLALIGFISKLQRLFITRSELAKTSLSKMCGLFPFSLPKILHRFWNARIIIDYLRGDGGGLAEKILCSLYFCPIKQSLPNINNSSICIFVQ